MKGLECFLLEAIKGKGLICADRFGSHVGAGHFWCSNVQSGSHVHTRDRFYHCWTSDLDHMYTQTPQSVWIICNYTPGASFGTSELSDLDDMYTQTPWAGWVCVLRFLHSRTGWSHIGRPCLAHGGRVLRLSWVTWSTGWHSWFRGELIYSLCVHVM